MKNSTEITANAIYKITSKTDGTICYAVPSDSFEGHYYMTCYDEKSANWTCTCTHGKYALQAGRSAHCKHCKAAQTSILANKQDALVAPEMAVRGTLSSNRGFSLLK